MWPSPHARYFDSAMPGLVQGSTISERGLSQHSIFLRTFASRQFSTAESLEKKTNARQTVGTIAEADGQVDVDQQLRTWASDRAQVLSRTVRGVMHYADAIRIHARLEGVGEDEVEGLIASKFEYVVSCQDYLNLKSGGSWEDQWKAQCIDELRFQFAANLRIAYIDEVSSCLHASPKTTSYVLASHSGRSEATLL
ncbi:MAG: hypothetical protein SGPRY_001355 [Prymnesium sp.]